VVANAQVMAESRWRRRPAHLLRRHRQPPDAGGPESHQRDRQGCLGATGKGHGTDTAILLGLEGSMPDTIDPDTIDARLARIRADGHVRVEGRHPVSFKERTDMLFLRRETLPFHTNGVRLTAFAADGAVLEERRYFSVGGGFVVSQEEADAAADHPRLVVDPTPLEHPFTTGDALLAITRATGLSIAQVMRRNEHAWRTDTELDAGLDAMRRPRPVGLLLRRPRPVGAGCGASLGRSGAERADCTAVLGLAARRGTRCAPCRRSAQTAATKVFTWSARVPKVQRHCVPKVAATQSVAAGGARWWRFQRRAEERSAGAVRAAHFVNILTEAV
jgi:hypothetical protein